MIRRSPLHERLLGVLLIAGLAGCVIHSGSVVLLPQSDGGAAAVTIKQGDKTVVLDQPYAGANLTSSGPQAYTTNAEEVRARFGAAIAAQPTRQSVFTVYFVEQSEQLTEDSKQMLDDIIAQISRYAAPDVVVIGHTDLVGSDAFNDALARKRAEAIRALLAARGVPPDSIVAIGRGKRDPAIPTPDGIAEPRNRRVEIVVR